MPSDAMREVADRQEITEKLYRYCRSVDRCDPAVGYPVFHPDSKADFPGFEGTGRGWIDYICKAHMEFLHHSHQLSNVIIEIDGDRAGSESYVTATLRRQDGDKVVQHEFWARYVDKWSKRGGEWAIDHRTCIVDFGSATEVNVLGGDPRGTRDHSDPSYTVLKSA